MRNNLCLATFLALALSAGAGAQTGHRGSSQESLRGIGKVAVVVEEVNTQLRPAGSQPDTPDAAAVKAGVEEQLRAGGVQTASAEQSGEPNAALHLSLVAHEDERAYNHYELRLWLTQEVVLPRATPVRVVASTWDSSVMGYGAGYQLFERNICDRVHDFIQAYRVANSLEAPPAVSPSLLPPMRYNGPCPLAERR